MGTTDLLHSWRFLLSRRWILFGLAVVVLGYGTWWLGEWQFDRLEDRRDRNAIIEANENQEPVPVGRLLSPGTTVDPADEWRVVTATGSYVPEDTIVVRYRTRDGVPGVQAVVPLVTGDGTTLLVDRGWLHTENRGITAAELPDPPAGEVTVTGYVRADGTGTSTAVADLSTRAISSVKIGEALDREVYGGFVELKSEDPEPAEALAPVQLPERSDGPHFFYGLQWWFFGLLALVGFGYLAWDERKHGPRGERPRRQSARNRPPSTGSITPEMKDAAGERTKAATRPNSSGSP